LEQGYGVATINARHFEMIPDLIVKAFPNNDWASHQPADLRVCLPGRQLSARRCDAGRASRRQRKPPRKHESSAISRAPQPTPRISGQPADGFPDAGAFPVPDPVLGAQQRLSPCGASSGPHILVIQAIRHVSGLPFDAFAYVLATNLGSAVTFTLQWANAPRNHTVQEAVTQDQRVEQHCARVGEKGHE
jgi:hypothetical protein